MIQKLNPENKIQLSSIKGEVRKQKFLIDPNDCIGFIDMIKNDLDGYYAADVANQIKNKDLQQLKQRINLDKNRIYVIGRDGPDVISYFVFMKKKVDNDFLIGIYKYKLSAKLPESEGSSHENMGETNIIFKYIEDQEFNIGNLSQNQVKFLYKYAAGMEDQFQNTNPADL